MTGSDFIDYDDAITDLFIFVINIINKWTDKIVAISKQLLKIWSKM